ncbi:hypothetical protein GCM10010341_90390 [Streptomyces noursei]|nr:hypothetical protein GCM10010341_90390 [Streptomyces noursei]
MLGKVGRGCREAVGEAGDGLAGDREALKVRLGLPQPCLQAVELRAKVVGQGPDGALLEVQCLQEGTDVHVLTASPRQVEVFVPVRRRIMTWDIAQ